MISTGAVAAVAGYPVTILRAIERGELEAGRLGQEDTTASTWMR